MKESISMLLSYCKRKIKPEELKLKTNEYKKMFSQLENEKSLLLCEGLPKIIEEFAYSLESTTF